MASARLCFFVAFKNFAGIVYRYYLGLPSQWGEFDSRYPLQVGKREKVAPTSDVGPILALIAPSPLHRNRRYFVIKLHTWFCLSYFLKTIITFYCIYQYFKSINSFFQHRICFSIQPPDYSDPWLTLARSSSFFLIMLFNNANEWMKKCLGWIICSFSYFTLVVSSCRSI